MLKEILSRAVIISILAILMIVLIIGATIASKAIYNTNSEYKIQEEKK